jgi:hypothetical protein
LKEINVIYAYGIGENGVEPQYEAIAGSENIAVENSRFRFKCMGFVQNPDKTEQYLRMLLQVNLRG